MHTTTANSRGARTPQRRLGRLAATISALLAGGLVLAGCTSESDAAAPTEVLAEYQETRNAAQVGDPESLDALMSLYAPDAVVTGHPLDRSDPPTATGVEEIRPLESQAVGAGRDDYAVEFFDVETSGDQATFHTLFFNIQGECFGASSADAMTVEDGAITRIDWAPRDDDTCDPQRLAQTYGGGMSVEFTGDDCVYSGPTGFTAGDRFDVTATDSTSGPSDVGYAVEKMVDGTTVDDAERAQEEGNVDEMLDEGHGTFLYSDRTEKERFMSTTLDVSGTWLLYCFLPSDDEQVYSTALEVVG